MFGSNGLPNINTQGCVPLIYHFDGKDHLIIVRGGIRGSMFPVVYGTPYLYPDFVWSSNMEKTPTEEECFEMVMSDHLYVDESLCEKIVTLLSS